MHLFAVAQLDGDFVLHFDFLKEEACCASYMGKNEFYFLTTEMRSNHCFFHSWSDVYILMHNNLGKETEPTVLAQNYRTVFFIGAYEAGRTGPLKVLGFERTDPKNFLCPITKGWVSTI